MRSSVLPLFVALMLVYSCSELAAGELLDPTAAAVSGSAIKMHPGVASIHWVKSAEFDVAGCDQMLRKLYIQCSHGVVLPDTECCLGTFEFLAYSDNSSTNCVCNMNLLSEHLFSAIYHVCPKVKLISCTAAAPSARPTPAPGFWHRTVDFINKYIWVLGVLGFIWQVLEYRVFIKDSCVAFWNYVMEIAASFSFIGHVCSQVFDCLVGIYFCGWNFISGG